MKHIQILYLVGLGIIGVPLYLRAMLVYYSQPGADCSFSLALLSTSIILYWPISLFWFIQEARSVGKVKFEKGDCIYFRT